MLSPTSQLRPSARQVQGGRLTGGPGVKGMRRGASEGCAAASRAAVTMAVKRKAARRMPSR
ncbi:MAG: hypothetical protein FD152_2714 [Xanthobacteraceae bacterium]|nr:MAG: hypothetical protein FD152_2714 [Xanthobacteraceae bacterium]